MYSGFSCVLTVVMLTVIDATLTGVSTPLRASAGPGLMRLKDGKPVPFTLRRPVSLHPHPSATGGSAGAQQASVDMKELARRYIDEMLTQELKLQMDRTKLEKILTEMLMWRKAMFDTPRS